MDEEGRRRVLEACGNAEETRIVIIHGTDTMTGTAGRRGGSVSLLPVLQQPIVEL